MEIANNWVYVSWDELKLRKGKIDYIGKSEDYKEFTVFKCDSFITYYTILLKDFIAETDSDCKDFYDNYKTIIDEISPEISTSSLPNDHQTYFCGFGDTSTYAPSALGEGTEMFFALSAIETSATKTVQFNDDFYLVDGYFCGKTAPFGASITMEVLDYNDNVVSCFAKKIPIFNSILHFENNNRGFISKYYKIKITVFNSEPGLFTEHDTMCGFKVFGCLKLFRKNIYCG
jgi:hypothetical protein